ncbi:hypothetical protein NPIL_293661 [Nephila pilipes]|uniref:Uncharacterized protein n=1 Tax=Nephila pilipes TaxID=299642 RepID=A0A8X6N0S8_NEPPI|nr:hypothetical protein NPIL_293661 [Nephila pilipes]
MTVINGNMTGSPSLFFRHRFKNSFRKIECGPFFSVSSGTEENYSRFKKRKLPFLYRYLFSFTFRQFSMDPLKRFHYPSAKRDVTRNMAKTFASSKEELITPDLYLHLANG